MQAYHPSAKKKNPLAGKPIPLKPALTAANECRTATTNHTSPFSPSPSSAPPLSLSSSTAPRTSGGALTANPSVVPIVGSGSSDCRNRRSFGTPTVLDQVQGPIPQHIGIVRSTDIFLPEVAQDSQEYSPPTVPVASALSSTSSSNSSSVFNAPWSQVAKAQTYYPSIADLTGFGSSGSSAPAASAFPPFFPSASSFSSSSTVIPSPPLPPSLSPVPPHTADLSSTTDLVSEKKSASNSESEKEKEKSAWTVWLRRGEKSLSKLRIRRNIGKKSSNSESQIVTDSKTNHYTTGRAILSPKSASFKDTDSLPTAKRESKLKSTRSASPPPFQSDSAAAASPTAAASGSAQQWLWKYLGRPLSRLWSGMSQHQFSNAPVYLLGVCYKLLGPPNANQSSTSSNQNPLNTFSLWQQDNSNSNSNGSGSVTSVAVKPADEEKHRQRVKAFIQDFTSRIWMTYRDCFPPLLTSSTSGDLLPRAYTSDSGWGCMIRSAQMLMAQTLLFHSLGREWRRREEEELPFLYSALLRWFVDSPSAACPFSIHALLRHSAQSTKPGEWVGPRVACFMLARCAAQLQIPNLAVIVSDDGTLYRDQIIAECTITSKNRRRGLTVQLEDIQCRDEIKTSDLSPNSLATVMQVLDSTSDISSSSSAASSRSSFSSSTPIHRRTFSPYEDEVEGEWRACLLLVPVMLGVKLNAAYFPSLLSCFQFPQCVGIIGGKPRMSLYLIGVQEEHVFFLDPHVVQHALPSSAALHLSEVSSSYHCRSIASIAASYLDPSLALGFYCSTRQEFEEFFEHAKLMADTFTKANPTPPQSFAVFHVAEHAPNYSKFDDDDDPASGDEHEDDHKGGIGATQDFNTAATKVAKESVHLGGGGVSVYDHEHDHENDLLDDLDYVEAKGDEEVAMKPLSRSRHQHTDRATPLSVDRHHECHDEEWTAVDDQHSVASHASHASTSAPPHLPLPPPSASSAASSASASSSCTDVEDGFSVVSPQGSARGLSPPNHNEMPADSHGNGNGNGNGNGSSSTHSNGKTPQRQATGDLLVDDDFVFFP